MSPHPLIEAFSIVTILCLIFGGLGVYSIKCPSVADRTAFGDVLIMVAGLAWLCAAVVCLLIATAPPAAAGECAETANLRDALERIALLDEADGHELKLRHAFEAVAIASNALGKHPSGIFQDRYARGCYTTGCGTERKSSKESPE